MGLRRLLRQAKVRLDARTFRQYGLARFDAEAVRDSDVVIAAWPKSGNTWMQCLVAGLQYGVDSSNAPDRLIQTLVPDLHQNRTGVVMSDTMAFKSHHTPQPQFRRVIHLVRDGRDALVSYWHFRKALGYTGGISDLMGETDKVYSNWWEHTKSWRTNPHGAEILTMRYEDLLSDPQPQLRRVAKFLDINCDDERLAQVISTSSFSRMQKREKKQGWDNKVWPKDAMFVRRGVSGAFLDEMSPEDIAAFETRCGDVLQDMGYELSSQDR
ncbi:sulfotransferase domain-containing protein [Ruegeria sp. HKCCD8929]|uniref:sulfotransferase domain-containing protein n=1 Tax=Ruegeria sp. HKCCD8929 TaxID=2683006 RepID=UPI0014898CB7|nr:sulfotransferase domain-containing protein [Ruegeria sp. HKCCD8929]